MDKQEVYEHYLAKAVEKGDPFEVGVLLLLATMCDHLAAIREVLDDGNEKLRSLQQTD